MNYVILRNACFRNLKSLKTFVILSLFFSAVLVLNSGAVIAQSAFDDPGSRNATGTKGGDLVSVNGDIDAGDVALGSSSQIVILMRNDGVKPINIKPDAISLYPSSNVSAKVAQNECALAPLPPGAACAIAVSVKGLQPGRFRIEMLMRHDGRSKLTTSTISGLVDVSADDTRDVISDLETIPSELDYGSLKESRPLTRSIVLRNVTSKPISVSSIDIESNDRAGYTLKSDCETLDSGAACIATVTWAPQQRGPATGVLVVNHDGPTGVVTVILDGTYEPNQAKEVGVFPEAVPGKGLLTASQTSVDFGDDIESSSSITVSLVNVGDAPVNLQDISISNEDSGIQIANSGCGKGKVLKPVEACPLTLTWEPVRVGNILDDVQIRHDGARGILVLPITGRATKTVNQDSKSIVFNDSNADDVLRAIRPLSLNDLGVDDNKNNARTGKKNSSSRSSKPIGSLEGYRITSLAKTRAIVSGPGGSRVVFSGEQTVIGGVLWQVSVQSSSVKFANDGQQVLLLFDRSLAPFNDNATAANSTNALPASPTSTVN